MRTMQRRTKMQTTVRALLLAGAACTLAMGAAGSLGCQEGGSSQPRDLSGGGSDGGGGDLAGADLLEPPAMMTTIRDLNDGKVPVGTFVQVEAVVTAPRALASAINQNQVCLYELAIGQGAATPTLHDGILIRQDEKVASGDMMVDAAQCQARVPMTAVGKPARGAKVQVRAVFQKRGSLRYLDLTSGRLTDLGPASMAELPQPVDVTTQQLVSDTGTAAFYDASGALVRFLRVGTGQRSSIQQTFKIAPTAGGAATRINPAYLKLADAAYMAPPDGTMLSAVIGIVSIDLGGTVSPRDTADVKP
jgi:hypothetical protein